MPGLTRRTFLTRGTVAVAAGSVATAIPGLGSTFKAAPASASETNDALTEAEAGVAELSGPMVAQVTDIRSGEIRLYHGESQVVMKNHAMVAQMVRATPQQER